MELPEKPGTRRLSGVFIGIAIICLLTGGILGYAISSLTSSREISDLQSRLSTLQGQVSDLQSAYNSSSQVASNNTITNQTIINENITYVIGDNASLSQLYEQVKSSVVVVHGIVVQYDIFGRPYYSEVQGSGFVSNLTGQSVIVTNFHVVDGATNITVTFTDGDAYSANVLGSDPYADLAALSTNAPQYEYEPLRIASSSALKVGDPVVAVGTPLGYTGSMTSGIVSALGRTVAVSWSNYAIADCIQTTTPINPGNSGGPLLNYEGQVVGITSYTATYEGVAAQGLGLAIPSTTVLREVESLVANGTYDKHPWLGASGVDMSYGIAQAMNVSVTYGWLIAQVTSGGPASKAGLKAGTVQAQVEGTIVTIGGDIITAFNGKKIANGDDLSAYLEEYTLPGQTINATVVRGSQELPIPIELGTRPPPTA